MPRHALPPPQICFSTHEGKLAADNPQSDDDESDEEEEELLAPDGTVPLESVMAPFKVGIRVWWGKAGCWWPSQSGCAVLVLRVHVVDSCRGKAAGVARMLLPQLVMQLSVGPSISYAGCLSLCVSVYLVCVLFLLQQHPPTHLTPRAGDVSVSQAGPPLHAGPCA